MTSSAASPLVRTVQLAAGVVVVAAGLHFAASTVNLLLISVLLAMTVSPVPYLLEKRGMKHGGAVMLTVLGSLVVGGLLVAALGVGLSGLQAKLPVYQEALARLLSGLEDRLAERGVNIHDTVKPDTARMIEIVQRVVGGALGALGYSIFALILVALILLELPAHTPTDAPAGGIRGGFDQVSVSVRRFVALTGLIGVGQAGVNLVVMLLMGTDFAVVWGVLFFLLNFVPFGFIIGMIPPFAVTLLEHGPAKAGLLFGVLMVANLISDNVVKPKVMGTGLGLSPLVIVISLMFWGVVLGPVGAILAVPLTIALTTMAPALTGGVTRAG
jgi:predicted PurR-regulated permease PerM